MCSMAFMLPLSSSEYAILPVSVDFHRHFQITIIQLCTVDMEIRELERLTINLVPELVFMESDTVLVQYIISSWSLQNRNDS